MLCIYPYARRREISEQGILLFFFFFSMSEGRLASLNPKAILEGEVSIRI